MSWKAQRQGLEGTQKERMAADEQEGKEKEVAVVNHVMEAYVLFKMDDSQRFRMI